MAIYSGSGSNYHYQGAAAWVNFRGTSSVSIRRDWRVSSISDNGQGRYQVNWDGLTTNDYCITTIGGYNGTNGCCPLNVFSNGGFNGSPQKYDSSGVKVGNHYADWYIVGVAAFQ